MSISNLDLIMPISTAVLGNIIRYLLLSGGAYLLLHKYGSHIRHLRIQKIESKWKQAKHDLLHSLSTAAIQGILTTLLLLSGWTKIYSNVADFGWPYLLLSGIGVVLVLDTYFYFSHRLLHWKPLLKYIHISHHMSKVPTALSTIAFHPLESVIQWLVFPLIVCSFPCNMNMLIVVFGFTFLINNLGHVGYEFYPKNFVSSRYLKWSNTSTFHNMHHTHVSCNYGLYFSFWDRVLKTTHPDYQALFLRVKSQTRDVSEIALKSRKKSPHQSPTESNTEPSVRG